MPYGNIVADIQTDSFGSVLSPSSAVFRNRLINGQMQIDQRNAGASVTPTNTGAIVYSLDRWFTFCSVASKFSVQQNAGSVTPPVGFTNYLGITSLSAYSITSTDQFVVGQTIEGFNIADLGWGTANAKTVTLSFQVYSSLTGTFGGSLRNSAANRSYPFSYTISSANTWTNISITVAGDTTGTWLTTNGIGVYVSLSLGAGSTLSGTAGSWAGANYISATGATSVVGTNGATFYITGCQLERGTNATSFEYRPYGTELALCQRYFYSSYSNGVAVGTALAYYTPLWHTVEATMSYCTVSVSFPVSMRANPTGTIYSPATGASGKAFSGSDINATIASAGSYNGINPQGATVQVNNVSVAATVNLLAHLTASAEL